MKTKEEILKEECGTTKFRFHDSEAIERSQDDVLYAMERYGNQMYNQALDDIIKSVQLKGFYMTPYRRRWRKMPNNFEYDPTTTSIKWEIDKKSILKLKKE